MRTTLMLAIVMFCAGAPSAFAQESKFGAQRPNIIFIVTDDHGYNDLEATDLRGEVSMPNVNRLSAGGALMTQAYCTAPQCVPSRAGIVTGRYQQRFRVESNKEGPLPTTQKSIASRLKGLGYTTGHVGKWHLDINRGTKGWMAKNGYKSEADIPPSVVSSFKPQGFGYDEFAEGTATRVWSNFDVTGKSFPAREVNYRTYEGNSHKEKYRIQLQTELAMAFIDRHVVEPDPFFLYLGYYGPHVPLDAPASLTDQVLSLSELQQKGYDHSSVMIKKSANYAKDYTEAEVRQQGLALLKGIDNGVGDIYRLLEEKGKLENTLIFFMSDNGAPLSVRSWDGSVNDPWHGAKGIIFEGGSRIPYIVHWKGVIPSQVFDQGVNTLDAGATAVAVAGGDPDSDPMLDGVNLIPHLTGKDKGVPHRYLYQRFMNTASIIEGKLKYMRHENGEELLFDVAMEKPAAYNPDKDFHEAVNLIEEMPKKAAEFRKELKSFTETLPVPHYSGGFHSSLYEFAERQWGLRENSHRSKAGERNSKASESESTGASAQEHRNTPPVTSPLKSVPIQSAKDAQKPNVIMILIDDMGWADSASYGSVYYDTPNLTRLCGEGMRFTDAYAAAPLCSPTRASIISGQYPARLRMTQAVTPKNVPNPKALPPNPNEYCGRVQNRNHLPLEVFTLAEALKEANYHTAHIGKWHLSPSGARFTEGDTKYHAENQGFDFVIGGAHRPGPPDYYSPFARKGSGIRNLKPGPEGEYLNERLAEESIKWIESVKDSHQPFYLNFWHYAVHGPIIPKKDLLPKYNKRRDPKADQRCPEMATMLDSMDNSIGMLLDWLDKPANRQLKENTLIILTSDNGGVIHNQVDGNPWTSNRPLRGGKANTYEGGVREPWIVRWPGKIQPGTVCHDPVQSTDIYPTVLEAAGVMPRDGIPLDGKSIVPLLHGNAMKRRPIFTHFPHNMGALCAPSTSVRLGDWKLIRFFHAGKDAASHAYELFDLKRDPFEAINLADHFPEKVRELDRLIETFLGDTDALVPFRNPDFVGDPQAMRTGQSLSKAPKRPRALRLNVPPIKTDKAGNRLIQLTDQEGASRRTHAMVLEGSEWVRVNNNSDGSVELRWDAASNNGTARILFGWKGGAIPQEINLATIPACVLELSRNGSEVSHEYVMLASRSVNQAASQSPAPGTRSQEQFFKSRDRNGDGAITLEEFIGNPKGRNVPALTKRFKNIDSNGDGKLHLSELKKQTE